MIFFSSQILQLSSSYTPEISDFLVSFFFEILLYFFSGLYFFQEASVLGVEEDTVKVRYTDATVSMLIQKGKI